MHRYNQINEFLHTSNIFYTLAIGVDSVYSYVSPNYDRNFSLGKGTLKGQHFSVTLHPDDVQICEQVGPLCFGNPGKLFPATLRKHNGSGGFVITQWEMQAIFDAQGQPEGIFCIGYNITEHVDTRERLDKAEVQLDEISFVQSHGVRRPLANIMALSRLFEQDLPADERKDISQMMISSANDLDTIIRDISNKNQSS